MRLTPISRDEMTEHQRATYDESVASKRGRPPEPMLAWLHSPEMARHATRLGAFLRYDTSLGARLTELPILVTARHWSARFEWYAHRKLALAAGMAPDWIDAINRRQRPAFGEDAKADVIYDVAKALHETRGVPEPLFGRARALLGERGLVEVVGLCGYYTLVSMTLNTYEFPVPEGEPDDLLP
jgi:4-carboxymuconolactone decarboxylase